MVHLTCMYTIGVFCRKQKMSLEKYFQMVCLKVANLLPYIR